MNSIKVNVKSAKAECPIPMQEHRHNEAITTIVGVEVLKGETGPMGPIGPVGPRGLQGERGEKGEQGEQGLQ